MPPGVSVPNMSGAIINPLESIGEQLSAAPIQAADQQAALQAAGWKTISPYITALSRNPALINNQSFVNQLQRTAQMFRISGPMIDQAIQQLRDQTGQAGTMMQGPTSQPADATTPSAQSGGGAVQTGPAQVAQPPTGPASGSSGPQGPSAPSGSGSRQGSTPNLGMGWDQNLAQGSAPAQTMYQQDLDAAARTPKLTGNSQFQQKLLQDGRALGRTPQQIAADVKAAQVKAGVGPHPETLPADQAQIRADRQAALRGGQAPASQGGTSSAAAGQSTSPSPSPATSQSQDPTASQPAGGGAPGQPQAQDTTAQGPAGATGPTTWTGPRALPPAMQALMASAGVAPSGMGSYGQQPMGAAEAQAISQAQPKDRPQLFANFGIDPTTVPASVMNAPVVMTEGQRITAFGKLQTDMMAMVKQGQDPTGVIMSAASMGVITPDQAQQYLSSPEVMQPLQAAAEQNLQILHQNGLIKGEKFQQLQQAIAASKTTQDLNRARIKYLGAQQPYIGSLMQARVAEANSSVAKNAQEVQAMKDGTWFQQQTNNKRSLTDQITDARALVTSAQTNYDTVLGYGKSINAAFGSPESAMMPDGSGMTYPQALAAARDQLDTARATLKALTTGAATKTANDAIHHSGGGNVKQPKGPPGTTYAGEDTRNKKAVFAKPGGGFVYQDNKPVPP